MPNAMATVRTLVVVPVIACMTASAQFGGGHEIYVEGPQSLEFVDLTSDGAPDLLIGSRNGLSVHVNLGQSFGPAQLWTSTDVVGHAADLDGDGWTDIVGSSEQSGALTWYRNVGSLGLGPAQLVSNGPAARAITSGDLDGDGDRDLLVTTVSGQLRFLENSNGLGQFAPGLVVVGPVSAERAEIFDRDADGDLDVVWNDPMTSELRWCENLGGAAFAPPAVLGNVGIGAPRDLDNDGLVDLVMASAPDQQLQWQRGLPNGFGPPQPLSAASSVSDRVLVQDLDLDGDLDVAVASHTLDELAWYEHLDGQGSFGPRQVIASGITDPGLLIAGDVDGDGDAELFTTSVAQYRVVYFDNLAIAGNSIVGRVFNDVNADGVFNGNDHGLYNIRVEATDVPATFTNHSGMYSFSAVPGPYAVWLPPVAGWTTTTPDLYNVTVTTQNNSALERDFGLHADQDVVAMGPVLTPGDIRCNEVVPYWFNVQNIGTLAADVTAALHLDPLSTFAGAVPPPDAVLNGVPQWTFVNVPATHTRQVQVLVQMPDETHVGEQLDDSLAVVAMVSGTTHTTGVAVEGEVGCAVDPNDKQVLPRGMGPEHLTAMGTTLVYTIRFQNTGNIPAGQVVLHDSLDQDLDLASLRVLGASHVHQVALSDDGLLTVTFPDIQLPDSASDPVGSQGYLMFAIDHHDGLAEGSTVHNRAAIHFDQNAPVITNTVLNTLTHGAVGVGEDAASASPAIAVVPNPVSSTATIVLDERFQGRVELMLLDASGREVRRVQRRSSTVVLDRQGLGGGLYMLHVRDEAGHAAVTSVLIER
ncbi:MAG: hypothetical protein GFGODING_01951 [Flavobacteriales bacterium]|nr:hypothetical protein [Flavobacteriales bacterium]